MKKTSETAFAASADIKGLANKTALDGLIPGIQNLFSQIEQSPKVTIAIIGGYAAVNSRCLVIFVLQLTRQSLAYPN